LKIWVFRVSAMMTNCYFLCADPRGKGSCAVIDPGGDPEELREKLEAKELTPEYFLLTHGHFDHIMGLEPLRKFYPKAKTLIHSSDANMLTDVDSSYMRLFGGINTPSKPADRLLSDGDEIKLDGLKINILHTPGHTPGSVCYIAGDSIFCGDTIFRDSIGRYDLAGGNWEELKRSLKKIKDLPGDYRLYPGHGSSTSLDRERRENSYLNM